MTDNPVRDLLDSVSTGQPQPHRLSVNDLVRAGRGRQKRKVAIAAGGTAGVAALGVVGIGSFAGGSATPIGGLDTPTVASTTAAPTSTAAKPTSTTAATASSAGSGQPSVGQPTGSVPTTATSVTPAAPVTAPAGFTLGPRFPIYSAQVLDGDRKVWAQLYTKNSCDGHPVLGVDETATEVRVSIYLSTPDKPDPKSKRPCEAQWLTRPPAPPTIITSNLDAGGAFVQLRSPLGSRRLVDAKTGKTIPYDDASAVLLPGWLPAGFHQVGAFTPWDSHWGLDYAKTPTAGAAYYQDLNLDEFVGGPKALGQPANATVGGRPAWYDAHPWGRQLDWWQDGIRMSLTQAPYTVDPCLPSENAQLKAKAHCDAPSPDAVLTKAEMIKLAESLALPKG